MELVLSIFHFVQLYWSMSTFPNYYHQYFDFIYSFFFSLSANVLSSEVEEARLLLDTAERARKHAEVI